MRDRARFSVWCLALSLWACTSDGFTDEAVDLTIGRDPSMASDGGSSRMVGSAGDAACSAPLQQAASKLLASHQTCERDEDCRGEAVLAPCPAPVACDVFVRTDTDQLWSAMEALKADYLKCGARCPLIKCQFPPTPKRPYCGADKRCAGRDLLAADPTRDAGATDAGATDASLTDASATRDGGPDAAAPVVDAAVGNDAGMPVLGPFACQRDLDCTVQNVGSCCGFYPRCANVAATFAPPVCAPGQASNCGFPVIDSCACRAQRCVGLQAGIEAPN